MKRKMYDAVGIDMPCIDLNINMETYPKQGRGGSVKQLSWQGGGKAATGMVASARLGAKCAMMGCVGDDVFGDFIIKDFKRHGIDTDAMKVGKTETSAIGIVLSDYETGNRTILYRNGSVPGLTSADLDFEIIRSSKYLFICGAGEAVYEAVKAARMAGTLVLVDADGYTEEMLRLIPQIDVFIGSEFFYGQMFGAKITEDCHEKNCRKVKEMGPGIAVFTLGEKGCVGVGPEGYFRLPAFKVDVSDTVGAGDVFHGAYLAGLVKGQNAETAARFASGAAAIKCTRIGGRAAIPDEKTLDRFLTDGYIDFSEIDERVKFYERGLENV